MTDEERIEVLDAELKDCQALFRLLQASALNVLDAHDSGDEALLDEALARMGEVLSASTAE